MAIWLLETFYPPSFFDRELLFFPFYFLSIIDRESFFLFFVAKFSSCGTVISFTFVAIDALYDIGTGLEVFSPWCPHLFLEMAGLGNFAKVYMFLIFF